MTNQQYDEMLATIQWAKNYVDRWNRNGEEFDPLAVLEGNEPSNQLLFTECLNYLESLDRVTCSFRDNRNAIVFTGRIPPKD